MGKQAQPTRSVILCLHGFLSPSHTPLRCVHRVWARVPLSAQSKAHYDPSSHWSSASQRFLVDTCAQVMQPQTQGRPTEENFTNLNILQFKMTKIEQLSPEKNTNPLSASIQIPLPFWCFHFLKSQHLNLKIVAINSIVVKNKDLRSRIPEFECHLSHSGAVWPGTRYSTLCFNYLI